MRQRWWRCQMKNHWASICYGWADLGELAFRLCPFTNTRIDLFVTSYIIEWHRAFTVSDDQPEPSRLETDVFEMSSSYRCQTANIMLAHTVMLIARLNSYGKFVGFRWQISQCHEPKLKVKVPRSCLPTANIWPRSQRIKICRRTQTFWPKDLNKKFTHEVAHSLPGICSQTNKCGLRCLPFTEPSLFWEIPSAVVPSEMEIN